MTCLILSAEFLSSSQHSAALDSGHAGRDVLCIRDPKTWPCFGMAWLLLDSCFLLLVPHYRDKMGHPDPRVVLWYTLHALAPETMISTGGEVKISFVARTPGDQALCGEPEPRVGKIWWCIMLGLGCFIMLHQPWNFGNFTNFQLLVT